VRKREHGVLQMRETSTLLACCCRWTSQGKSKKNGRDAEGVRAKEEVASSGQRKKKRWAESVQKEGEREMGQKKRKGLGGGG
jgi:hypothetical protein